MLDTANSRKVKQLLDSRLDAYLAPEFIQHDPVQIPHLFRNKEDIEIAGLLAATISWGQRKSIIVGAKRIISLMDSAPFDFVQNHTPADLRRLQGFVYRTFNGSDLVAFIGQLQGIYHHSGGLEAVFSSGFKRGGIVGALSEFRAKMLAGIGDSHMAKHVANVDKGSACKRLNMFLRWMVRSDASGVDFGLWNQIPAGALAIPLDVNTALASRMLGLLTRKQNDWRAVVELTEQLQKFDPIDPIKYDFALFSIGQSKDYPL
ncbi:MAG TPA: TIGR02757 family protein [Williamwhitmania sp.]|nr:TIGR02757 family protein [Williamwhitmania sp.]